MGNLLHDWFPDAPTWVPWLAFYLTGALFLFFLACLVASPFEAWRNRQVDRDKERYVGLTDTGSLTAVGAIPASHRKEN